MDERSDHLGKPARNVRDNVAQQVDMEALPVRFLDGLANGYLQAPLRVGDDEVHAAMSVSFRPVRIAVQDTSSCSVPTSAPRLSRPPSAVTPVAIITAREAT